MSKRILMVLVIAAAALWVSAAFAAPNMQPGKWEITMKMEMKDMPMEMPPVKASVCLTDNDMVPQKAEKNQDCKMISNKIEGSTVTWVMHCRDKKGNTIDSNGKITYKGASFKGHVEMDMTGKDGKQHMSQQMSGKRIGDCTK